MNTQQLLDKALADLRLEYAKDAVRWFEFPFVGLVDENTLIFDQPSDLQAAFASLCKSPAPLKLSDIDKEVLSEEQLSPELVLAKCRTRLISEDQRRVTDARTEFLIVRKTPDGLRLAASLNLFGGHIDLSSHGPKPLVAKTSRSPDELIETYTNSIRTGDLATLGKTLEFPAVAISADATMITPDFETYLEFATQKAAGARASGVRVSKVEPHPPRAVGADLILVPITLHMSHVEHGDLPPYDQILCLRIGQRRRQLRSCDKCDLRRPCAVGAATDKVGPIRPPQ